MIVRTTSRAAFECRDRSCAPPPVGTGGSRPSGGGGGRRTKRTAEMEKIARHQLKRNGFTHEETEKVLGGGGTNGLKAIARGILSRNGFGKGEISALIARDTVETSRVETAQRSWERPFIPGKWEVVSDVEELVRHGMSGAPTEIFPADSLLVAEEILRQIVRRNLKKGAVTYVNGGVSITIEPGSDGKIKEEALNRVRENVDRLMVKFPPAVPVVAIHVTRQVDEYDPSVLGSARVSGVNDYSNVIRLDEDTLVYGGPISQHQSFYQASPLDIRLGDWIIAHEWGHVTDRRNSTPEPPELFDSWSWQDPLVGLSRYGRTMQEEGYAESFADWFTSGGKTVRPATLAYQEHYGWEVP